MRLAIASRQVAPRQGDQQKGVDAAVRGARGEGGARPEAVAQGADALDTVAAQRRHARAEVVDEGLVEHELVERPGAVAHAVVVEAHRVEPGGCESVGEAPSHAVAPAGVAVPATADDHHAGTPRRGRGLGDDGEQLLATSRQVVRRLDDRDRHGHRGALRSAIVVAHQSTVAAKASTVTGRWSSAESSGANHQVSRSDSNDVVTRWPAAPHSSTRCCR